MFNPGCVQNLVPKSAADLMRYLGTYVRTRNELVSIISSSAGVRISLFASNLWGVPLITKLQPS